MEQKKQKKDQFVIACLERPESADTVLPVARHCAERLGKGIILLNVSKEGDNTWLQQYGLPYAGLKGDWKTAIDGLPTAFGGVLAVTAVDPKAPRSSLSHPGTLLRAFADCRIAYLTVGSGQQTADNGQWPAATALTIDHSRESKEKLIWGSYMVRFFGSLLTVAIPPYRDAGLLEKLGNNMLSLQRFYRSMNIGYKAVKLSSSKANADRLAVRELAPDLLIAMTTDRRDLGDLLLGSPESHLLTHSSTPILFLNHRDDLYVLCD